MISGGGTIVHLTDPMDHSGVEKNPFRERGLPCIDMRSNPNVPCPLKRYGTGRIVSDF
jgi:hypothetical protein